MELEELEVLFKVNTAQIQPMLDKLQSSFQQALGKTADTAKSGMEKTENALNISKGIDKVSTQLSQMNEKLGGYFSRMSDTASQGSDKIGQATGKMFMGTKTQVSKDLDGVVQTINAKMSQAKAAQAKMHDLMNQKSSLSTAQQSGSQGIKIDSQVASANAQMTRYQTQAKALAQSMRSEFNAVPESLNQISTAMDRNETQINGLERTLSSLKTRYREVGIAIDDMGHSTALDKQSAKLESSLATVQNRIAKLVSSNDSLNKSYAYVSDRGEALKGVVGQLNTELGDSSNMAMKSSSSMREMGNSMSSMSSRMKKAGNDGDSSMRKMASGTMRSRSAMTELIRQIQFLPAMLVVYGLLYQGIMNLASGFGSALMTNKQFSNSMNQIQVNLLTAFYPIYTAILPAINAMMSAISKATGWIASFVSALTGMNQATARSGAKGLYTQVQAMNDTGSASKASSAAIKKANEQIAKSNKEGAAQVKEANKQITASNKEAQDAFEKTKKANQELAESLMGFDEINVLDSSYGNDSLNAPTKQALQTFTPQDKETADSSGSSASTPSLNFDTPVQQSNGAIKAVEALKKAFASIDFAPLHKSIDGLMTALKPLNKDIWDGLKWGYDNILMPLARWTISKLLPGFLDVLSAAVKLLSSLINASKPAFTWFWDTFLKPLAKWSGGVIIDALKLLVKALTSLSDWVNKHQKAVEFVAKTLLQMFAFKVGFDTLNKGTGLIGKLVDKAVILGGKGNVLGKFFGKITGLSSLKEAFTNVSSFYKLSQMGWENFGKKVAGVIIWIKGVGDADEAAAIQQKALNLAMKANVLVWVVTAIAAVVAALVWFFTQTKTGRKIWSDFMDWLKVAWTDIQKFFKKLWDDIAAFFIDTWNAMKKGGSAAWNWISDTFKSVFNALGSFWKSYWNLLSSFYGGIWNGIKSIGSGAWNWISSTLGRALDGIGSGWRKMWGGLSSFFGGIWGDIKGFAKSGINGVIGIINDGIGGIDSIIHTFGGPKQAIGKIPKFAKGTAGAPKGLAMVNDGGGQEAIVDNSGDAHILSGKNRLVNFSGGETVIPYEATKSIFGGEVAHFAKGTSGWMDSVGTWFKDKWDGLVSFLKNPLKSVGNVMTKTIDGMLGGKSSLVSSLAPAMGNGLVTGIISPITSLFKSLKSKHDDEDSGAPAGKGVERWRDDVEKALKKNGLSTSTSMVNKVLRQIATESGGNEKAVQGGYTDVNTLSGDLAKGLMQTISATFNHYKFPGHGNIFNGYDNLLAALAYAKNRYGSSLSYLGQGHGYANGGIIDKDGLYRAGEGNKAEMVLPLTNIPRSVQLIKQALKFMGVTFSGGFQVPKSLTSQADLGSLSTGTSSTQQVQGGGISDLSSNIINALTQALQMTGAGTNGQSSDLNLTIKIGTDTIGKAAIVGINDINRKNGRNMLNI